MARRNLVFHLHGSLSHSPGHQAALGPDWNSGAVHLRKSCRKVSAHASSLTVSSRKQEFRRIADATAPEREKWLARAAFFHAEDLLYLRFLIGEGARVLELGCGTGELLAALKPSYGVGVDFSAGMIGIARRSHQHLTFFVGDIEDGAFIRQLPGPFDVILVVDTLGAL